MESTCRSNVDAILEVPPVVTGFRLSSFRNVFALSKRYAPGFLWKLRGAKLEKAFLLLVFSTLERQRRVAGECENLYDVAPMYLRENGVSSFPLLLHRVRVKARLKSRPLKFLVYPKLNEGTFFNFTRY